MSESTEQVLKNNYDAFGKGNIDPLMSSLADDVEWHVSGGSPLAGEYIGKTEILNFFGKMMRLYGGTLRLHVVDILTSEKHCVVLTQEESQYNGKTLTFRSVHLWQVRDGKFSAFHVYYDDAYHRFWPVHG